MLATASRRARVCLLLGVVVGLAGLRCDPGDTGSSEGTGSRARAAPRRAASGLVQRTIRVGGVEVLVEVADNPTQQALGLMFRDSLPEQEGMLFVYPEERVLAFWMRNTRIPLDIAFIDAQGVIVDVQSMEPYTETPHVSARPARYALEVRRGWFARHGVGIGDRVALE